MTLEEIARRYAIAGDDLLAWVGQEWLRPARGGAEPEFDECDVARVELICELRRDLAVDDAAVPVVLSLLDQLYATRRLLRGVGAALSDIPEPARGEVLRRLEAMLERY